MAIMKDGYQTLISLGGTNLYEKSVTPPGIDAGGAIDTTTMRNSTWRTKCPKQLKSLTDSPFTAAYDPDAYTSLLSQIGVNQEITLTFPDGEVLTFWGWLDAFNPGEHVEGEQPTAECVIMCSNVNGSLAETAPALTSS